MKLLIVLYKLVLRHQVNRNRIALVAALTALALLLGLTAVRPEGDSTDIALFIISQFGLGLVIPVVCLVLGSAALGEWVDDETMVYVWLRPVPRWIVALAAYLAVLTVCIPVNLIPLFTAIISGGITDRDLLVGTAVATVLATIAYCSLFLLLGLVARKALAFGLLYVFVWEFSITAFFPTAGRLSIGSYAASALGRIIDMEVLRDGRADWASWVIPVVVALVGIGLTTWRLENADVA